MSIEHYSETFTNILPPFHDRENKIKPIKLIYPPLFSTIVMAVPLVHLCCYINL